MQVEVTALRDRESSATACTFRRWAATCGPRSEDPMRKSFLVLAAVAAVTLLGGCAYGRYGAFADHDGRSHYRHYRHGYRDWDRDWDRDWHRDHRWHRRHDRWDRHDRHWR